MDQDSKGGVEKLEETEGQKTIIRIQYARKKKHIFKKMGKKIPKAMFDFSGFFLLH